MHVPFESALFERHPHPMWLSDAETFRHLAVNDAALKVYGYTREEFLKMTALELRPTEEHERFVEAVRAAPESVTSSGPWTILRRDGERRQVMTSDVLIEYEGRTCRLVSIVDVTEELRSKRERELVTERYRVVRDAGRDAAWDWDLDTGEVEWGENLGRTYGYMPGEVQPTPEWWSEKVHPRDRRRVSESLALALERGDSTWIESYRFRKKSGEYVEVIDRGRILTDDATGRPVRMIGAILDVSPVLESREELRRAEDRANQILESVSDAFVALDGQGVITYVNRRAAELSGSRVERLVGQPLSAALPFASAREICRRIEEAIFQRTRLQLDGLITEINLWFEALVTPLDDGMALVFRDVTQQFLAQERARQSHQRYELLAEATKDCIWDLNLDTMEFECNRAFAALLGQPNVVRGDFFTWWRDRVHPADWPRLEETVQSALQSRADSWEQEYRIRCANGVHAVVLDRCRILRDASGRATRLIGSIVDLTESRATAAFLQEVLDHSVDVMMTLSPDGTILHVNAASERIFGFHPMELIGESFAILNLPGDVEAVRSLLHQVSQGNDLQGIEKQCVGRDGQVRDMLWTATWSELRHAIFAVGRDITESKRSRQELERLVEQHQELANRAQAASRSQTEFLQNMSHELRTPLNGLIGMGQLLAGSPLSEEQRSWVDIMLSSGEALVAVVNDVLDLARIEIGRLELHPQPFSFGDLVRSSAGLFGPSALAKGLRFEVSVPDEIPLVAGDSHRLRQVLNNLIGNAVKFTDFGSVEVSLGWKPVEDGATFRVDVRDTGVGIDSKFHSQLFERFFQADMTTTRRFGGTGIGLSLAKALIERMGGEIGFESEVGVGSHFRFEVTLPVIKVSELSESQAPTRAPAGRGMRVLIAEDKPLNVVVVKRWLERQGYDSDVAEDGLVALELLQQNSYDLLLLDLHMPRMDGYTAAAKIREREREAGNGRLPIIAVTAAASQSDRARAFEAGVDAFLPKPVSFTELSVAIATVTKQAQKVAGSG